MRTTNKFTMNQQDPNMNLFNRFHASSLTYNEMFTVRGGDKEKEDDELSQGSTADKQEDGFN